MQLYLLGVLLGASLVIATCPEKAAKSNFEPTRLAGVWHSIKRAGGTTDRKCFHNVITSDTTGALNLSTAHYDTTSKSYFTRANPLTKEDPASSDAKYYIQDVTVKFYVIDTDYTNFAVFWLCGPKREGLSKDIDLTWLVSRTKSLSSSVEAEANGVLPPGEYVLSDQTDCPEI